MIVTVLGPISPEQLGVTDAHDHLFLRSPALPGQDFEDTDRAVEEVTNAASGGLHAIVEVTPIGLGRRPAKMRAVAEATGVHVVAAAVRPARQSSSIPRSARALTRSSTCSHASEYKPIASSWPTSTATPTASSMLRSPTAA